MPLDLWEELAKIERQGESAALVTVIRTQGSTPREVGARMIVRPDGRVSGTIGGSAVEALVIGDAQEALRAGQPRIVAHDLIDWESDTGMICGGRMEFFIEPLARLPQVYLFGGGHVGLALSRSIRELGYPYHLLEDRPEYATLERFPDAAERVTGPYSDLVDWFEPAQPAYIIIVTRCHDTDLDVLRGVLRKDYEYLGMICSQRKKKEVFKILAEEGFTAQELERVHAPIGLDIGSQAPAEIAISIMAEVVKEFKSHNKR